MEWVTKGVIGAASAAVELKKRHGASGNDGDDGVRLEGTLGECIAALRDKRLLIGAHFANFVIVPLRLLIAKVLPLPGEYRDRVCRLHLPCSSC